MDEGCNSRHDEFMRLKHEKEALERALTALLEAYIARYCPDRDEETVWTSEELLEMFARLTRLLRQTSGSGTIDCFGKGDFPTRTRLPGQPLDESHRDQA